MEPLIWWTVIRLLVPLTIFRWPLFGTLISMFADILDYSFLLVTTDANIKIYQFWDKSLDIYYLSLAAYTTFSWIDKIAQKISIALFTYRALGIFLFIVTYNRKLLFLFPNFFENFFLFYLIYLFFTKKGILFSNRSILIVVLTAIFIPKLIQEYFVHIMKTSPVEIITSNQIALFNLKPNFLLVELIQAVVYSFLPALALLWVIKHKRK